MATSRQRKKCIAIRRRSRLGRSTTKADFKATKSVNTPDEQSQRKAFVTLMPYLYVLRNKGCSWLELAGLLNGCGFSLQPATVRTYYTSEIVAAGK